MLKVLVACEESQRVTEEFRRLGHEAYSCDIIDTSGSHLEWHIRQDVLPLLESGEKHFRTCDGAEHKIDQFDLILAFPPCTDIAVSGALRFEQKRNDGRQRKSIEFFCKFFEADCDHVMIENPVNVISGEYVPKWFPDIAERYGLPKKPTQSIHPWMFGHPESKKTCLWLKNLPPLEPTEVLELPACGHWNNQTKDGQNKLIVDGKWIGYNDPRTKIYRAKTYPNIAKAMAEQWSQYLEKRVHHGQLLDGVPRGAKADPIW